MTANDTTLPPRRVLIAPDKFKGTLTAKQAAAALMRGMHEAWPAAEFTVIALADGGEGFAECLVDALGGRLHATVTVDALGRACTASWGELFAGTTAAIDIASASGLAQIPMSERDPLLASTFGTGLVLREILARRFDCIYLGLGGTATNDAGLGIATALGFRFSDAHGREVPANGAGLGTIERIEPPRDLPSARFVIATDVDNPLYGPRGAAWQFAAQKGASERVIRTLDAGLEHFAAVVTRTVGRDFSAEAGAGAAGGVGFGMMALLNAQRRSGFEVLREQLQFDRLVASHDLIVTGEGAFDTTSLAGKAPAQVARIARGFGKPVWGVFGRCEIGNMHDHFDRHVSLGSVDSAPQTEVVEWHAQRLARAAFELARGSG